MTKSTHVEVQRAAHVDVSQADEDGHGVAEDLAGRLLGHTASDGDVQVAGGGRHNTAGVGRHAGGHTAEPEEGALGHLTMLKIVYFYEYPLGK